MSLVKIHLNFFTAVGAKMRRKKHLNLGRPVQLDTQNFRGYTTLVGGYLARAVSDFRNFY